MGNLSKLPIEKYRERFGLKVFAETGTWHGDALLTAAAAGFAEMLTVDINSSIQAAKRVRELDQLPTVYFYQGDSVKVLPRMLGLMSEMGPALWWLDAHYGTERYGAPSGTTALPLLAEIRTIIEHPRDHTRDVFLADDLRIFGVDCRDGPLPDGLPSLDDAALKELCSLLDATHAISFNHHDTGYLIAQPLEKP